MAGVVHAGTQTWGWGVGALLATGEATGTAVAAIDHTPPPVYLRSAFRRGLRLPVPRRSASYDASAVTTTPKHPVQPARGSRHSCHKKTAGRASYSLPLVGRRRSPPPCWFGGVRAAKPVRIHPGMIYGKLVLCGRGGLCSAPVGAGVAEGAPLLRLSSHRIHTRDPLGRHPHAHDGSRGPVLRERRAGRGRPGAHGAPQGSSA
jgi:hypothetical protein